MLAKLAALFLYYQVFEVPRYRCVIAGTGVIVILQGLISCYLSLFDLPAFQILLDPGGYCQRRS